MLLFEGAQRAAEGGVLYLRHHLPDIAAVGVFLDGELLCVIDKPTREAE